MGHPTLDYIGVKIKDFFIKKQDYWKTLNFYSTISLNCATIFVLIERVLEVKCICFLFMHIFI